MAKWEHSDIIPYFCDKFGTGDESCLPYLPEEWKCSIQGKNEEIDILNSGMDKERRAGTINLLKRPGLKTWKIDCFFAHPDKPEFAKVKDSQGWTPTMWVEFFESAMYEKKVLEMTVTGLNIVCYVTVENFEHSKKSGEELDTYYNIELKEYFFTEIKKEEVIIKLPDTIPPTGNTGGKEVKAEKPTINAKAWLREYCYKGYSIANGLSNPVMHPNRVNEQIKMSWLPVEITSKNELPLTGIVLTNKGTAFKSEITSSFSGRTSGMTFKSIEDKLVNDHILNQTIAHSMLIALYKYLFGSESLYQTNLINKDNFNFVIKCFMKYDIAKKSSTYKFNRSVSSEDKKVFEFLSKNYSFVNFLTELSQHFSETTGGGECYQVKTLVDVERKDTIYNSEHSSNTVSSVYIPKGTILYGTIVTTDEQNKKEFSYD